MLKPSKSISEFYKSVLFIGLITPIVIYNIINYAGLENVYEILSKIFLTLSIYLFFFTLFKNEKKTFQVLMILFFPTLFIEFFNLIILKQYLSHDNIKSVYYSNWNESSGFVKDYVKYAIPPIIFIILLIYILFFKLDNRTIQSDKKLGLALLSVVFGILSFSIPLVKNINSTLFFKDKNIFIYTLREDFFKTPPFNFYFRINELRSYVKRYARHFNSREHFSFDVSLINDKSPDVVVLVIGEAMRHSNWTINGYEKITSPYLMNSENLISFQQHFSNANQTSNSIPTLMTKATPIDFEIAFKERSIIGLFKEANYKTYWISNQFIFFLENQTEPDSLIANLDKPEITDLETFDPFNYILESRNDNKVFILINLIGNHTVPPSPFKNHFKPNTNEKKIISYSESKEELINDYDNKILFQDYILGELINSIKKKNLNSILVFTADHGITLFDDKDSSIFGYGSDNLSIHELHIPLFIWYSEQYMESNNAMVQNLKKNKNKVSDNLNIFYTVADLSGIQFLGFNPSNSLARTEYKEKDSISVFFKKKYEYFQIK